MVESHRIDTMSNLVNSPQKPKKSRVREQFPFPSAMCYSALFQFKGMLSCIP